MDGSTVGLLGGVFGILGGVYGTYMSLKGAKGPQERAFIKRCAAVTWVTVSVFLGLLLTLPQPYNFLLWIPYGIAMLIGIPKMQKRHTQIRQSESDDENFSSHL